MEDMMKAPKVILAPVDFSAHSDDALSEAADLATLFGSQVLLVNVVAALPKLPNAAALLHEAEYESELHTEAQKHLENLSQKYAAKGITVRTEVGTANDVPMEILRIGEHNGADLIVIATHGMTGWRQLAFGSVTDKVVRLANCPVLVLRAKAEASASSLEAKPAVAAAR
jgi:nucleotide-binding universal stress UspA family protein